MYRMDGIVVVVAVLLGDDDPYLSRWELVDDHGRQRRHRAFLWGAR